jgi:hypothetical protein
MDNDRLATHMHVFRCQAVRESMLAVRAEPKRALYEYMYMYLMDIYELQ